MFLFFLILFSGALLLKTNQSLSPNHIGNYTRPEKQFVVLKGIVATPPDEKITQKGASKIAFLIRTKELKLAGSSWQKVKGLARVQAFGRKFNLEYGDLLMVEGNLSEVKQPSGSDDFNYREYLARKNIYSILNASSVKVIEKHKGNPVVSFAYGIKDRAKDVINKYVAEPENLLLNGIILGERKEIPKELNDAFVNTGTVHILAISGLNVSLVVFIFLLIFKMLRMPAKLNIAVSVLLVMFYAILTGAQAPVVRAAIMSAVLLTGRLINREADLFNLLGLSAIIILIFAPQSVFEASFILSYASVLSILIISPVLKKAPRNFLVQSLLVSFWVWICIWPIVAHYFDIVSFSTILANLFVVPLSFACTYLGFLLLFCSLVSNALAGIIGATAWFCAKLLIASVQMFSKIPFSYIKIKGPSIWQVLVYYAILIAALVIYRHRRVFFTYSATTPSK